MIAIAPSEVAVASCGANAGEQEQERDDHDPAADTEERAEDAGDQADRDEPDNRGRAHVANRRAGS